MYVYLAVIQGWVYVVILPDSLSVLFYTACK